LVPHYRLAARAEEIGKPLFVWTVDDPKRIRRLFGRRLVEAIVTNDPRQALALRASST
jgi:glycerophosphoryl diester phosphodiesterase